MIEKIKSQQINKNQQYKIVVEGHTDGRPVVAGIYPSNWELSGARAAHVVRMFLDQGFTPSLLTAIGYADTHPRFQSRAPAGLWNEEALAKNRRVVLRILEAKADAIPFPDDSGPAILAH